MRITVLAHNLRVAGGLSVGKNVMAALRRVANENDYQFVLPAGVGYEQIERPRRATVHLFERRYGAASQLAFEHWRLPRLVRDFQPDVIWGLGNMGLKVPPAPQAILFHQPQMIYETRYQRDEVLRARLAYATAKRRLKAALPATGLIFCQTEVAAQRFRRYMGYRGRIAVMPNAVSEAARDSRQRERPAALQPLANKQVLFCLTRYYAHKNLEILVEVFRRYADDLRDFAVVFTVQGDQHPHAPRFLASLRAPAVRDHLLNVGPVTQEALPAYYGASAGLILPTLLESFSGTYLEAMEFGRPILTSDLDFARVVCGPAALYFDPFEPASIRDALVRFSASPTLRETLVEEGAHRRNAFVRDWDDIVRAALAELTALVVPPQSGADSEDAAAVLAEHT